MKKRQYAFHLVVVVVVVVYCLLALTAMGKDTDDGISPPTTSMDSRKHIVFISVAIRGNATPLLRIAKEMVQQGYRVSFATHDSGQDWVVKTGANFLSAGEFPISAEELRQKLKKITKDSSIFRGILAMFNEVYLPVAKPLYDALYPILEKERPDIVVMDIGTFGAQYLVDKLEIPYIVNSPTLLFDLQGAPSFIPAWGTGFSVHMSLWNRCMNVLFPRLLSVALTPPFMYVNKVRWDLGLAPFRSQHDIFGGGRILLNTAFGLEYPRALSPLYDMVGPIIPTEIEQYLRDETHTTFTSIAAEEGKEEEEEEETALSGAVSASGTAASGTVSSSSSSSSETLSPMIRNWLNNEDGIIYINFGSMSYIDNWQAQEIVRGLTMEPGDPQFRVLWIVPNDQRSSLPRTLPASFRVKALTGGLPHLKILSHSSIQVVFSHCGMASVQEALYFDHPVLCLPFFADQPDVAARILDAGVGLTLDKSKLTRLDVRESILELHRNTSYHKKAKHLGKILRRAGGIKRSIRIIDAELQYGSSHLKTLDLELPWHKTIMLDVIAIYVATFCLLLIFSRFFEMLIEHFVNRGLEHLAQYFPQQTYFQRKKRWNSYSLDQEME